MQNGGGGGKLERVSFLAKNGDRYGDSALITTQGKSLERQSEAPFLAQKSFRERLKLESTFEKSHDSKSNAHSLSSRASETSVAIHKGTQADSRVDCHADFQSARNDRKNAASEKVDSKDNAENIKNLESTFDNTAQKSKKVDSSSAQNLHDQANTLLSKKAGKKPVLRLFATTLLGFLHFAGVNAIYFYIAQGISSSLLFPILRHFPPLIWWGSYRWHFALTLAYA
ncbi:Uncharacterised protein [Helicobacter canis]|uniref:Uncharacterized protein n=1 Tax=Helicobacter canis TaxID=29419 RepID=A0A377J4I8_9HELI|nr:Uncharacterised protein [Helicobacter canis]